MYGKILTAIEANNFDNFRKRAYISKTEKLLTLPFSYAKSLNPGTVNKVRRDSDQSNPTQPNPHQTRCGPCLMLRACMACVGMNFPYD